MSTKVKCLIVALALSSACAAQDEHCEVAWTYDGSAPPLSQLFACARHMEGKPYSDQASKACLNEVLSSGYFLAGDLKLRHPFGGCLLEFRLKAPTVLITEMNIDVPKEELAALEVWIHKDQDALKVGTKYDS